VIKYLIFFYVRITGTCAASNRVTCQHALIPGVIKFILDLLLEPRPMVMISLMTITAERCLCWCCNLIVTSFHSLGEFFTCLRHNLFVLTNMARQQVILKRGKPLTTLCMNLNNHHVYNLSIQLFELEIRAMILPCNARFEVQ